MSGNHYFSLSMSNVVQHGDCNGALLSGRPMWNNCGMPDSKYFYLKQRYVQFLT